MRLITLLFAGLTYCLSAPVMAKDSHCHEEEQIVFSCSLGKKMVSVCTSKNISPTSGYLQYRFGTKNKPELIFPKQNESSHPSHIQARTLMFSGGGGSYLRFINGNYNYIVYTAIGKGWGNKEGVLVEKDHRPIANLKCLDSPVSLLGENFFSLAGLANDEHKFEIP